MKINWAYALAAVACVSMAACDKLGGKSGGKAPEGQVVATVDGKEVTLRELRAELNGATFADPKVRKAAEAQALQAIVSRRLLVKAAQERGLDKTPDFELQKERMTDVALVTELQKTIVKSVPPAAREEAERYVVEHPDFYAQRKIYVVDQIRAQAPVPQAILTSLQKLDTLEQVESLFAQNKVNYERSVGKIDAAFSEPQLIDAINKLKPGDVFAIPMNQILLINRVTETKIQPFTGEEATTHAQQRLTNQHVSEAVMREYNAIIQKSKDKIQYNKDYKPPAGAAPAPPPPATNSVASGV